VLSTVLERGLVRLTELPAIAHVRGEGVVWGVQCAAVGQATANDVAAAIVEACYRGDAQGRAIHLLGPLAGKVLRVSPPLVMPPAEAESYLDAMYQIVADVGRQLA
jgi:4-aminobutyrate aminotransferase-like enzyme